MPAYSDVRPALSELRAQGHRLAVLTNSERMVAEGHLQRAELLDAFERVIGCDELGAYKPLRRVYLDAVRQLGGQPTATWLVAAHDWDIVGGSGAGLKTAFVQRSGRAPASVAPDRSLAALTELRI